ncbi:MAG: radical SAM protein [Bacteroidales bacterium]|nr:radical SAM protein [Bacteroidales bacterium]
MNYLAKGNKLIKGRINKHSLWLTHVITYSCNANCEMCSRIQKDNDKKKELSREENLQLIDNAARAGIVFYTMYGGEPLLYKYAPDVFIGLCPKKRHGYHCQY